MSSAPQRVFLTAEWRSLVMLNYAVDPAAVANLVPANTELDSFNGKTYISLVGFRFLKTRVLGLRVPFHQNFEEVNLRFYVRRQSPEGIRRGVVFIRELVPLYAVAALARLAFNENYISLPMSSKIEADLDLEGGRVAVEYTWRWEQKKQLIAVETQGVRYYPEDDSVEQFISEHYWGYARQPKGGTLEYQVQHPRWQVWRTRKAGFKGDALGLYGPLFAEILKQEPNSAFLADGSEVTVFRGTRIA